MGRKIGLLVVIAAFAGCDLNTTPLEQGPFFQWIGGLFPEPGFDQVSGTAFMLWEEGRALTGLSIVIAEDEPGAIRTWHLHHNTCEEGGSPVGSEGDYPLIQIDPVGVDTAHAVVTLFADTLGVYHVDVHRSQFDPERIACANMGEPIQLTF